ncbi:ATP-binding protein [Adlercreutzia sp. ZJ242]|uniref:ATP-binding protein n=1 Tax=Adlercreutzia sp. ZJ242 TaxID=2709409 RepID=UPI0013ED0317|nr:ATP-binding protein [Adlercreutzia sp. ZJ242]
MSIIMKRSIETEIERWAAHPSPRVLLVRGARRVGKTFAVETVGRRMAPEGFAKIDFQTDLELASSLFDGPTDDLDRIVSNIEDYKRTRLSKETAFLFFDEVQLCEKALNSLRFFSESGWRVAATGSQLGVATRHRKLPFPSGVKQIAMHPMTFEEFLWALGKRQMAEAIRAHASNLDPYVAHDEALSLFRLYQVVGGMPKAVASYVETESLDEVRVQQREIDETYTADMSDPDNGINALAARKVWRSVPAQLMRSSTKKFKYSEVERGGRRSKLMEPLDWLAEAGMLCINSLTESTCMPLVPYGEEEGSFFKVYLSDTGLMFYKLKVNPLLWLEAEESASFPVSSDFRGALAENSVMQALASNDLQTFYWTPPASWGMRGELDFLLQDDQGRVIPLEVKSARNVRAKTLGAFMERSGAPYAIILSQSNFGRKAEDEGRGTEIRELPLYAAFCIGEGYARW